MLKMASLLYNYMMRKACSLAGSSRTPSELSALMCEVNDICMKVNTLISSIPALTTCLPHVEAFGEEYEWIVVPDAPSMYSNGVCDAVLYDSKELCGESDKKQGSDVGKFFSDPKSDRSSFTDFTAPKAERLFPFSEYIWSTQAIPTLRSQVHPIPMSSLWGNDCNTVDVGGIKDANKVIPKGYFSKPLSLSSHVALVQVDTREAVCVLVYDKLHHELMHMENSARVSLSHAIQHVEERKPFLPHCAEMFGVIDEIKTLFLKVIE
ncbi:hypothetical protein ADUPG1_011552 [Aduncisulcus paluster]|uniref:Uncharacterized protein n=1 Tax=Aduncisulcus paluster TaxID=2918883 RepID=A0ABQ5K118_9EUKA|nr:hypothetical protein ADUPG1_011552 [Aduncisulcus paluster]